jgi:hypothetical protein
LEDRLTPTTFNVPVLNPNDSYTNAIALQQALHEANSLPGDDVIVLPAGSYHNPEDLTQISFPPITDNVTIQGAGQNATLIDGIGEQVDNMFVVNHGCTVAFTGLTITGAWVVDQGGAIYNGGVLTIDTCTLSGNSANNGGGIYNWNGTVDIKNSTLSGNTATIGNGGAIETHGGSLTMTNCTVNGNSAFQYGVHQDPIQLAAHQLRQFCWPARRLTRIER